MYKVLVISHSLAQAEEYHRVLAQGTYPHVSFRYPANLTHHTASLQQLTKQCKDVLQEEEIDAVLALCPEYGLIQAALSEHNPDIIGPKMEAVFLCMHRYYNKRLVLQGFNLEHKVYELEEVQNGIVTCDLEDIGGQAILRDGYAIDEAVTKRIKSTKQFWRDMHQISLRLQHSIEYIKAMLEDKVKLDKYPLAFEPTCIMEEQIPANKSLVTLHYVEACVANDTLLPWVISDIFNFKQKPKFNISYVCMPTRLSDSSQYEIWAIFREIAQHLISLGFNNHFLHARIAVYKTGSVKVLDIVPCLIHANTSLYRHVYQGGDNIQGHIDLGLGNTVWTPRLMPGRCAMRARYFTTIKEVKLDDLVDVKTAKACPDVTLLQHDKDLTNNGFTSEYGLPVVEFKVMDSCYETCHTKIKALYAQVLRPEKIEHDKPTKDPKRSRTPSISCTSASPESVSSRPTFDSFSVTSGFNEDLFPDDATSLQRSLAGHASPSANSSTEDINGDHQSDSGHSQTSGKYSDLTQTEQFKVTSDTSRPSSRSSRISHLSSPRPSLTGKKGNNLLDPEEAVFRLATRRGSNTSTASDTVTTNTPKTKEKPDLRRFSHI